MVIKLEMWATVNPSEEIDTIKRIFSIIYPFQGFTITEPNENGFYRITAESEGPSTINYLFSQVRRQRTVEAARKTLLKRYHLESNSVKFMINRQALTQGIIVTLTNPKAIKPAAKTGS